VAGGARMGMATVTGARRVLATACGFVSTGWKARTSVRRSRRVGWPSSRCVGQRRRSSRAAGRATPWTWMRSCCPRCLRSVGAQRGGQRAPACHHATPEASRRRRHTESASPALTVQPGGASAAQPRCAGRRWGRVRSSWTRPLLSAPRPPRRGLRPSSVLVRVAVRSSTRGARDRAAWCP
jgi:hypothetical protein